MELLSASNFYNLVLVGFWQRLLEFQRTLMQLACNDLTMDTPQRYLLERVEICGGEANELIKLLESKRTVASAQCTRIQC